VANNAAQAVPLARCWRFELKVNVRSHPEIRNRKESHATHTDVCPNGLHVRGICEYLDGAIPPLTLPTTFTGVASTKQHGPVQSSWRKPLGEDVGSPSPKCMGSPDTLSGCHSEKHSEEESAVRRPSRRSRRKAGSSLVRLRSPLGMTMTLSRQSHISCTQTLSSGYNHCRDSPRPEIS